MEIMDRCADSGGLSIYRERERQKPFESVCRPKCGRQLHVIPGRMKTERIISDSDRTQLAGQMNVSRQSVSKWEGFSPSRIWKK